MNIYGIKITYPHSTLYDYFIIYEQYEFGFEVLIDCNIKRARINVSSLLSLRFLRTVWIDMFKHTNMAKPINNDVWDDSFNNRAKETTFDLIYLRKVSKSYSYEEFYKFLYRIETLGFDEWNRTFSE